MLIRCPLEQDRWQRKPLCQPHSKNQAPRRAGLSTTRSAICHRGKCRTYLCQLDWRASRNAPVRQPPTVSKHRNRHISTFSSVSSTTASVPATTEPPTTTAAATAGGRDRATCREGLAPRAAQAGKGLLYNYVMGSDHSLGTFFYDLWIRFRDPALRFQDIWGAFMGLGVVSTRNNTAMFLSISGHEMSPWIEFDRRTRKTRIIDLPTSSRIYPW